MMRRDGTGRGFCGVEDTGHLFMYLYNFAIEQSVPYHALLSAMMDPLLVQNEIFL